MSAARIASRRDRRRRRHLRLQTRHAAPATCGFLQAGSSESRPTSYHVFVSAARVLEADKETRGFNRGSAHPNDMSLGRKDSPEKVCQRTDRHGPWLHGRRGSSPRGAPSITQAHENFQEEALVACPFPGSSRRHSAGNLASIPVCGTRRRRQPWAENLSSHCSHWVTVVMVNRHFSPVIIPRGPCTPVDAGVGSGQRALYPGLGVTLHGDRQTWRMHSAGDYYSAEKRPPPSYVGLIQTDGLVSV